MKFTHRGIAIDTYRNAWNGKWGARYTLPGEDETHISAFADDAYIAFREARRNINRALDAAIEEQVDLLFWRSGQEGAR